MTHFASGDWPFNYGRTGALEKTAINMLAATASTSTEGSDMLTYPVQRTGIYRVTTSIRIRTGSTAGTSHTVKAQVAFNDGSAQAACDVLLVNLGVGTVTAIDAKTANLRIMQTCAFLATAGTNIVITTLNTITGVGTGTYDLMYVIEGV
jgi:hypothetical protein